MALDGSSWSEKYSLYCFFIPFFINKLSVIITSFNNAIYLCCITNSPSKISGVTISASKISGVWEYLIEL